MTGESNGASTEGVAAVYSAQQDRGSQTPTAFNSHIQRESARSARMEDLPTQFASSPLGGRHRVADVEVLVTVLRILVQPDAAALQRCGRTEIHDDQTAS